NKLLAQIAPALNGLPDDQAAQAAFALGNQFARNGQWALAWETFALQVERYPAHALSAEAYRWLIRHNSSSEARHRHELKQFVSLTTQEFRAGPSTQPDMPPPEE